MAAWRRHRDFILVLLGLALVSPALRAGFFCDDYDQIAQLEGWSPNPTGPLGLYDFMPADPHRIEHLFRIGGIPWWGARDLRLSFFRPLSSALIAADHGLFGRHPLPYHLHTLLWYAALLALGALVLRRSLPAGVATLAIFLFVVDDSHTMPAVWIAARHGTVSMVLVLLGLLAHQRWRERGWRAGAVLGPVACAVGLLGGESALAVMGYLLAWEVAERRPGWVRALLPYAMLVLVYLLAYRATGAGARGSGAYLDPLGDPLAFVVAVPERVGLMIAGLALGAPIDLVVQGRGRAMVALVGLAAGVGLVLWTVAALRELPPEEGRPARWLGMGALFTLLPAVAALPGDRVLLPTTLGAAAVFAVLLRHALRRRRPAVLVAAVLLALPNVVLAAPMSILKAASLPLLASRSDAMYRALELDGPGVAYGVLLQSDEFLTLYAPIVRAFESPRSSAAAGLRAWFILSLAATDHEVSRTDENTLVLSTPRGTFTEGTFVTLFRAPGRLLPRGSEVDVGPFVATVLEDRGGQPTKVAFRFQRGLEDGRLRFLEWRDGAYRRAALPEVGSTRPVHRGPPLIP
jgi:hypothetical protein